MADTLIPINADATSGDPKYAARATRQTIVAVPLAGASASRPFGVKSGVRPGTAASTVTVSLSGSTPTWTVNPHAGVIDAQTSNLAGAYLYAVESAKTGQLAAQDGTNARIDLVCVQVSDKDEGQASTSGPVVVTVTGTANGSLPVPAAPDRSIVLAQVNVPKVGGGAPTVTWVAPTAASAGGIPAFRSSAELTAFAGSAGQYADLIASTNLATFPVGLYRHDGTAWVPYLADTRWVSLPGFSSSNWTSVNTPGIRKLGSQVFMRGQVTRNGTIASQDGIFTLAAGWRPAQDTYISATTNSGATVRLRIFANGRVEVNAFSGTPTYVIFDGVSFLADL